MSIKQKTENSNWKNKLAKAIRVATIPPILVSTLILIIYLFTDNIFINSSEAFLTAFFLGIFPVLAYPFQYIIPALRKKGRKLQRKLAFVFTIIGYSIGMAWAFLCNTSSQTRLIMFSYFFAALILAFINLFTKIHASGHSCSATGVLIYTVYFFGPPAIIVDTLLATAIVWASLKAKRHTLTELATGALPSLIAFFIGYVIL